MLKKYLLIILLLLGSVNLFSEDRVFRFPDIHNNTIAYVYAGDIYITNLTNNYTYQLTSHEGLELFPKFSPDGKHIAYSATYMGSRQVYVIPVEGGMPKQLTYYNDAGEMPPRGGFDHQIIGWTPDGENIIFKGNRVPWSKRMGRYFTIYKNGGLEKPYPMPYGGTGDISPDGKKFVYTPIDREWRNWKRYRAGRAQDVWVFDLENITTEQITDHTMTDNMPVWCGDKILFTSDRDNILNLYEYDTNTEKTNKVTNHEEFDVLWPSSDGKSKVIYQNAGYLYVYDSTTNSSEKLTINVPNDEKLTLPKIENVKDYIQSASSSPAAERVVVGARGDLFTIPSKSGITYNITKTQGIREIEPTWSPDGKHIAYYSDATGEYQIYLYDVKSKSHKQLTKSNTTWMFPAIWSPDSKKLVYADKDQTLRYVDVETGKITDIDKGLFEDITYYRWSPDSKWITYTRSVENHMTQIFVYSLEQNKTMQLGEAVSSDVNPVILEGNYIAFFSNRDFNLQFSDYEFDYLYANATNLYVAPLDNNTEKYLTFQNDKVKIEDEKEDAEQENNINIETEGFAQRVKKLPLPNGSYSSLKAHKNNLYYYRNGTVYKFDRNTQKEDKVISGISMFEITADGNKILWYDGKNFGFIDNSINQTAGGELDLSNVTMKIDRRKEWAQIYNDAYRLMRDWFYDPDMHGYDWEAVKEKYQPMVDVVPSRADLDFILGELIGEVNAGHTYNNWGDVVRTERIDNGLLGCEFENDGSKYYKISKIFHSENWHEQFRNPLHEQGVEVNEGDYLISIDGEEVTTDKNPYQYLENKADKYITITVNDKAAKEGSRTYPIKTISSEQELRFLDWTESRRKYVEERTDGRIGYIWLPNTLYEGNRELYKWFYPLANKEALILDDRFNGGGFIPSMMIKLLERQTLNYWDRRGLQPLPDPLFSHDGPKACLINGYSSSGGDAFPYYFRKLGLGKLIGTTTWGGLIGISGNPNFADGGYLNIPTFRFMNTDGEWAVENEGVDPDIEVIDRHDLLYKGEDPSLDKAIELLMKEINENPRKEIQKPDAPDENPLD